jgi:hypothetical protein
MTKIEAERKLKKLEDSSPKWFCPSINGICTKACINFIDPFIANIKGNKIAAVEENDFEIMGFVCGNAQFLGHASILYCPNCDSEILMGRDGGHS